MPTSLITEPNRSQFCNNDTTIFFDWDDTLIPSSFLAQYGLKLDSPDSDVDAIRPQLQELEQRVIQVLTVALQLGKVMIVTNAEKGWVELSSKKFLPGLVPILSQFKVLSARSSYEPMFDSPLKWKYYAFQQSLVELLSDVKDCQHNIISFGDSHVEREAIRAVTRSIPNTTTKSVKFAEQPSIEQLLRQIELVTKCFNYIHTHDGDLDLQLTVTVNQSTKTDMSIDASNKENIIQQERQKQLVY